MKSCRLCGRRFKSARQQYCRKCDGPDVVSRFDRGLPATTTHCPACTGVLQREPALLRCRYGCGRLWPVLGGDLAAQDLHELQSGLRQHETDDEPRQPTGRLIASRRRGVWALLIALGLGTAGCGAPTAFAVVAFSVDAIGTGVGIYQRFQDRKAQQAQTEELRRLREEIQRLRKAVEHPGTPP